MPLVTIIDPRFLDGTGGQRRLARISCAQQHAFRTSGMRLAPPSLGLFDGVDGEGFQFVDEFA